MDTSSNDPVEVPASTLVTLIAASFDGSVAAVNRRAGDVIRQIEEARRTASQAIADQAMATGDAPGLGRGARVRHSNVRISYGNGRLTGLDRTVATVRFDGERADRLVLLRDLSPEPSLPLAVRHPAFRLVWPVEDRS